LTQITPQKLPARGETTMENSAAKTAKTTELISIKGKKTSHLYI
jgi:hypothetical protein